MNNELAKQIITDYVFAEFNIKSLYKFIDSKITDETDKKLHAESLLTKALQKGVVALGKETKKYSEMDNTEIRKITYESCPIKCTSCRALCDEIPVGQCRKNLSEKLDKQN